MSNTNTNTTYIDTNNIDYLQVSLEIHDKDKLLAKIKNFYENY